MPYVSLEDHELVDMILDRPEVILQAVRKLQLELEDLEGRYTDLIRAFQKRN